MRVYFFRLPCIYRCIILLILPIFIVAEKGKSQPVKSIRLYTISDPEDFGPKGREKMWQPQIGHMKIIYHHEIDPDNDGQMNDSVFANAVYTKIPDRNESGYCILNWEGPQFEYLKFQPINSDSMTRIVNKYRVLLAKARQLRPKAKWGIFDMPVTTYWIKQDTTWRKRLEVILPLIKEVDLLAPCLYDYFQTGSYPWMDDSAYYTGNLLRSLELGNKYHKPVFPFIWHRYHNATEKVGMLCIDPVEFENQVRLISQFKLKGSACAGLVWWQEDLYYYNISDPQVMKEAAGRKSEDYLDWVILKYLLILERAINN